MLNPIQLTRKNSYNPNFGQLVITHDRNLSETNNAIAEIETTCPKRAAEYKATLEAAQSHPKLIQVLTTRTNTMIRIGANELTAWYSPLDAAGVLESIADLLKFRKPRA